MKVQFTRRVIWYSSTWQDGEIVDLNKDLYSRLIRAGACVPVPETVEEEEVLEPKEDDKDITTSEDGSDSKSLDDSVSKDAPKRRVVRRHK